MADGNQFAPQTPGQPADPAETPPVIAGSAAKPPGQEAPQAAAPSPDASAKSTADDIQLLPSQAEQAIASVDDPLPPPAGARAFTLADLSGSIPTGEQATLDLLRDVELDVRIELGRANLHLEDVLKLHRGSVVSLDKLAGDPVDIYVNGRLIARGEVLVLNDNFCVRVAELMAGNDLD